MKVIMVRGGNGSGKSSFVREALGRELVYEGVRLGRDVIPVTLTPDMTIVAIGRYGKTKCEGMDLLEQHQKEIAKIIAQCMKLYKPEVILYESEGLSHNMKQTRAVAKASMVCGFEFIILTLDCEYRKRIERLEQRKGAKVSHKRIKEILRCVTETEKRIRGDGMFAINIDTTHMEEEQYKDFFEKIVKGGRL